MENIAFNILGIAFLGVIAVTGVHTAASHLETQANHVSTCIDQAGSQTTTC